MKTFDFGLQLGNGSGQESPGFKFLLRLPPDLWRAFSHAYLDGRGLTVADIYDDHYDHGDAYVVAEALIEFDELFQKFRANHLYLIHRSIGLGSKSLKGRPVEILEGGARQRLFGKRQPARPVAGFGETVGVCGSVQGSGPI